MDWIIEHLDSVRELSPLATAFASGMATIAAWVGLQKRILGWSEARKERRARRLLDTAVRAEWYCQAYKELVVSNKASKAKFHEMTVAQASAHMGRAIPDWALTTGWHSARVWRLA